MGGKAIEEARAKARELWADNGLLDKPVRVRARALTTEEAIGDPEGDDFPLQKGKERLMEAVMDGARGQAFSHRFGDWAGVMGDVADMDLDNSWRRALFVSVLNASMRSLGLCTGTIHCRDEEPGLCAAALAAHLLEEYEGARITQVGFQPAMIKALSPHFKMRVLDLDPDNIGKTLHGADVYGPEDQDRCLDWGDMILATGSTLVNDTLDDFILDKPTVFFGTTIAGAAPLLGLKRFCGQSK